MTCEAVLAETGFHLRSVSVVLAMLQAGLITLVFDCRERVLTVDRADFRVYRTNKRETPRLFERNLLGMR